MDEEPCDSIWRVSKPVIITAIVIFVPFIACALLIVLLLIRAEVAPLSEPTLPKMSVEQLRDAYRENELAADQRYKGEVLDVHGVVNSVESDGTVYLQSESVFAFVSEVRCTFRTRYGIANLRKGHKITVRGKCEGRSGLVNLVRCELRE